MVRIGFHCPKCGWNDMKRNGKRRGKQRMLCRTCHQETTLPITEIVGREKHKLIKERERDILKFYGTIDGISIFMDIDSIVFAAPRSSDGQPRGIRMVIFDPTSLNGDGMKLGDSY